MTILYYIVEEIQGMTPQERSLFNTLFIVAMGSGCLLIVNIVAVAKAFPIVNTLKTEYEPRRN